MKIDWIKNLENLAIKKWGRLFTCPYCEKRNYVEYKTDYFVCGACGFIFRVPQQLLWNIYKELKEENHD